jgi:PBP1b-binding outer membrane lipoprotein LpoB
MMKLFAVIVISLLFAGCSTISVTTPDGHASYTRIGNQDISGLRFERDNLGMLRLTLDKQSSDSDVLELIRLLVTK